MFYYNLSYKQNYKGKINMEYFQKNLDLFYSLFKEKKLGGRKDFAKFINVSQGTYFRFAKTDTPNLTGENLANIVGKFYELTGIKIIPDEFLKEDLEKKYPKR